MLSGALVASASSTATSAHALDPFEIQVYDGTANPPGVPGLELHANYVASGQTTAVAPEIPLTKQAHLTLEPSLGVVPFWEIGGYLQSTVRRDGTFDFAGVKVRNKFVTPPGWSAHVRLGLNLELSLLPQGYDRDRMGVELRPIAAWENDSWALAVNPILDAPLAGPDWRAGPTLEPAVSADYKIRGFVSLGLEYYADLGPIGGGFARLADQKHFLFEVANLLGVKGFELNLGVGEGLSVASRGVVLKTILGYAWESAGAPQHARVPGPRFW